MTDPYDLNRFVIAQNRSGVVDNYEAAVRELRAGRKTSHWIWFVFPQLDGVAEMATPKVGDTTKKFAIRSREEAAAYLAHDVLGPRLHRCAKLVVRSGAVNVNTLMGGAPDDRKLQSSMTLFAEVAKDDGEEEDFVTVLRVCYRGDLDTITLRLLKSSSTAATVARPRDRPPPKSRRRRWPFGRGTS
jgi:uncharacterized protein (DUF1810 family)